MVSAPLRYDFETPRSSMRGGAAGLFMLHGLEGGELDQLPYPIGTADGGGHQGDHDNEGEHRDRDVAADDETLEQRLVLTRQERADAEREQTAGDRLAHEPKEKETDQTADEGERNRFGEELGRDAAVACADRLESADLARPLAHLHEQDEEDHHDHEKDREQAA